MWKVVTEDLTRLAMLKRGEVDVAYSLRGPLGEEVKRTAGLKLIPTVISATQWLDFGPKQWDPKSPWHDRRVRLAAALAFDKNAINQAETLGHSKPTGSIIPSAFEFALALPRIPTTRRRRRSSWPRPAIRTASTRASTPCDASYSTVAEAIANYLAAVGIRTKLRPMERAAYLANWKDKKIRGIHQAGAGGHGQRGLARPELLHQGRALRLGRLSRDRRPRSSSRRGSSIPSVARRSCTSSRSWPTSACMPRRCGSWAS